MSYQNRNNFSNQENSEKSRYKLWCLFRDEIIGQGKFKSKTKVYFSTNYKSDTVAYNKLKLIVHQHHAANALQVAHIYDQHQAGKLVAIW